MKDFKNNPILLVLSMAVAPCYARRKRSTRAMHQLYCQLFNNKTRKLP
jgi:hypothetical protein